MASNHPDQMGISIKKPQYPQYAMISKRRESFKKWPTYVPQDPDILAEAGFVYTGVADGVRCYHCGNGLKNWEKDDEPWIEHTKLYPDCAHVKLVKGQAFINKVVSGERPFESEPTLTPVVEENSKENLLESDAAQSCLQMGFKQNEIFQAMESFISTYGHKNFRGADICEKIIEIQETSETTNQTLSVSVGSAFKSSSNSKGTEGRDPGSDTSDREEDAEEIQKLIEENERLKTDRQCKICLDSDASVVFLPCGHMVSCPMCASALVKCPICRVKIKGYIRSYLEKH